MGRFSVVPFLLYSKKYIDGIDKPILIKCYIGFQILDISPKQGAQ